MSVNKLEFSAFEETASNNLSPTLVVSGVASIGAGLVHAAAVGSHFEHRQVVVTFIIAALFQVGWGATAIASRRRITRRWVAGVGAIGNAALVGGFVLAKNTGIGFINGLQSPEPVAYADGLAAALASVAVITASVEFLTPTQSARGTGKWAIGLSSVAIVALSLPAMIAAANPDHHGTETATHTEASGNGSADGHATEKHNGDERSGSEHSESATAKAYEPGLPIDLGGVPGVTPAQQAAAENVLSATLLLLPKWSDPAVAEAAGFRSIGDANTGYEHFINKAFMSDGLELDPSAPESLVYTTRSGKRQLVAAMYIAEPGKSLDTVQAFGGKLTQWHVHDNLCFTPDATLAGLSNPDGSCDPPLEKTGAVPMIHVWITRNECGPFASLEGVGAGQVKTGETRACDTAHGGH